MSLDWDNPDPWDNRYYEYLLGEYLKRKMFVAPQTAPRSVRGGCALTPWDCGASEESVRTLDYQFGYSKTTGGITHWPVLSDVTQAQMLPYLQVSDAPVSAPVQRNRQYLESDFGSSGARPELRGSDFTALYAAIAALCNRTSTFWTAAPGGFGTGQGYGVVDSDDPTGIDGSRYIPNLGGIVEGNPLYLAAYQRIIGGYAPAACPMHAAPYNWPTAFLNMYESSDKVTGSTLLKQAGTDLLGQSAVGTLDGPVQMLKACYACLNKMTQFYTMGWQPRSVSTWLAPLYEYSNPLAIYATYRTGSYNDWTGITNWTDYKATPLRDYHNIAYTNQIFHYITHSDETGLDYHWKTMWELQNVFYAMYNWLPYPIAVDFYVKTYWESYDTPPVQLNPVSNPNELSYLDTSLYNFELGVWKKLDSLSAEIEPYGHVDKLWTVNHVTEAPAPAGYFPDGYVNYMGVPRPDLLAMVITPDFTA